MASLVWLVPVWRNQATLIMLSFLIVLGQAFFPVLYLLGIHKTGILALLNLLSRAFYVSGILLLVKDTESFYLVNVYNGTGWVLASLVGTLYIYRHLFSRANIGSFSLADTYQFARSNFSIFISNFLNSAYTKLLS